MCRALVIAVTGEGPTDMGRRIPGDREGFEQGPMCAVVEASIRRHRAELSPTFVFLPESELTQHKKELPRNRRRFCAERLCAPQNRSKFPGLVYRAEAFAAWAHEKGATLAVLFTDADGTRSAPLGQAEAKERAILEGFRLGGFDPTGVPMVPKPKSEAWLLAYFQRDRRGRPQPYVGCERFERMSGNDSAPKDRNVKALLAQVFDCRSVSYETLLEVDWPRVRMPSMDRFQGRLKGALDACLPPDRA